MIVSHKHKFIFIHTKKTAGTYVSMLLASVCGDADIIAPYNEEDSRILRDIYGVESRNYKIPATRWRVGDYLGLIRGKGLPIFHHHMASYKLRKYLPKETWESYYKFCFEREPMDKALSYIRWRNGGVLFDNIKKYEEFITDSFLEKLKKGGRDLYMRDGVVEVDSIFRYERIDEEIKKIERILGVSFRDREFKVKETKKVSFDMEHIMDNMSRDKIFMIYKKFYWEYENIYHEEKRKIEKHLGRGG